MQLAEKMCLAYIESGSATALLRNTVHIYMFVCETLGVPMLMGLAKYDVEGIDVEVSRIYYSFETGAIAGVLLAAVCCEQDVAPEGGHV